MSPRDTSILSMHGPHSMRAMARERVRAVLAPPSSSSTAAAVGSKRPLPLPGSLDHQTVGFDLCSRSLRPPLRGQPKKGSVVKGPATRSAGALKTGDAPSGHRALLGFSTRCERSSVAESTRRGYDYYAGQFEKWAASNRRSLEPDLIELTLLDYFDVLMDSGAAAHVAEKVLAAAIDSRPWLGDLSQQRLRKSLRGFRKAVPPRSRFPLAELTVAGLAMTLLSQGASVLARMCVLMMYAYLRPGEARSLLVKHIVLPAAGSASAGLGVPSVIICPQEDLKASKTQTFDDTIVIDQPAWLQSLMVAWRRGAGGDHAFLFQVDTKTQLLQWKAAIAALGLPPDSVMYQLRHAGASGDLLGGRRKLPEVLTRGRWRALSSVRRYGKPGQVQKQFNALSCDLQGYCQWSFDNLDKVLRGDVRVRPPPPVRPQ